MLFGFTRSTQIEANLAEARWWRGQRGCGADGRPAASAGTWSAAAPLPAIPREGSPGARRVPRHVGSCTLLQLLFLFGAVPALCQLPSEAELSQGRVLKRVAEVKDEEGFEGLVFPLSL